MGDYAIALLMQKSISLLPPFRSRPARAAGVPPAGGQSGGSGPVLPPPLPLHGGLGHGAAELVLLAWPHTGFGSRVSREIPADAKTPGVVTRYMIRPPITPDRILGDGATQRVIYRTRGLRKAHGLLSPVSPGSSWTAASTSRSSLDY